MDKDKYEHLSDEEQAKVFYESPFRDRAVLITHSKQPIALTQSLSPEELYLVTREMDQEDRCDIIRFANIPQLFFVSDIDCWGRDRIDAKGFLSWLEILLHADEVRLIHWLTQMDYEMVVVGFKKLVEVIKPEWEYAVDEVIRDKPAFTLDNYYYIVTQEDNLETLKRVFECLFETQRKFYIALVEGILSFLDDEAEENAFQCRQVRLSERGFPDPEIAHQVYQPITRKAFESFPKKEKALKILDSKLPDYPILWSPERFFLDEVMIWFHEKEPAFLERFHEELVWLSNKVIACEGIDFASEDRIKKGVERVRRLLSIGLEDLSDRDIPKSVELLRERWLETILRWGVTALDRCHKKAHLFMVKNVPQSHERFLSFLDAPWEHIFRGACQPIPQFHDVAATDHIFQLRDFKSLEEVSKVLSTIEGIECVYTFLSKCSKTSPCRLGESLTRLMGTAFCHALLRGKPQLKTLTPKELASAITMMFQKVGKDRILDGEKVNSFMEAFFEKTELKVIKPIWKKVFDRMEDELGNLDPKSAIDKRYVSCVL